MLKVLATVAIIASSLTTTAVSAANVGVSLSFEVAPVTLISAPRIEPRAVRGCEIRAHRVATIWQGRDRRPSLLCRSVDGAPLLADDRSRGRLLARP